MLYKVGDKVKIIGQDYWKNAHHIRWEWIRHINETAVVVTVNSSNLDLRLESGQIIGLMPESVVPFGEQQLEFSFMTEV